MRTQSEGWDREGFFEWLDVRVKQVDPPIPDMQTLAEMAEVSHSALSNWRSGRYKPSLAKLRRLARPLEVSGDFVAAKAGLIGDVDDEPTPTAEEQAGFDIIEATALDRRTKDRLKAMHLAAIERDRRERMRALREQVDLQVDLTIRD